jgi:hypothetical protein
LKASSFHYFMRNPGQTMKTLFLLASIWILSLSPAPAAEVNITAVADKTRAELGESVVFQVTIALTGYTQFTPHLEIPPFEGLQVRGAPRQQQGMNWVNGQVSQTLTVTWELIPIKSGRLKLGPARIKLKDPAHGEITKEAPAVYVNVARATSAIIQPTPTLEPNAGTPQEEELRPIKPDLGFPFERLGLVALGFLSVLGLAVYLALRPAKTKPVEVVRNPGQKALFELEEARRLLKTGDEAAYFREVARILREYFKVRLALTLLEPTLTEIQNKARAWLKQDPGDSQKNQEGLEDCFNLLVLVLFARHEPRQKEIEQLEREARNLVLEFEERNKEREEANAASKRPSRSSFKSR